MENIIDGVKVIFWADLMKELLGSSWYMATYEEEKKAWDKWQAENDAAYYGELRENFSVEAGVKKAKIEGKKLVVVDDLS